MDQVTIDELTFDVQVAGPADGTPVVLLHGFPQTSRSWRRVVAALDGDGLRLIAPDQRGYSPGARPGAVSAYRTEVLAEDVIAVAAALGHRSFHLVGHDWGASVAWWLAAHRPDVVRSLTAVSVPHLAAYGWALRNDPEQQQAASYIGLFRDGDRAEQLLLAEDARRLRAMYDDAVGAEDLTAYVEFFGAGALTPALNWYRAMTGDLAALPPVTVPTTYVWSDADRALTRAGAERCGDHVSGDYRFVELAGVSHWIPDEAPEPLADAIRSRVNSARPTP